MQVLGNTHRYTQEIPDLLYRRVMASPAMELKLGVFGFLPTTRAKTNAIQMCPQSLHAVQRFPYIYPHAKTAVDAGDIRN